MMRQMIANKLDIHTIWAIAVRTFRAAVHAPTAYIVAIFYYGFVGGVFGMNFLIRNHGAIDGIGENSLWILWFVVPGLTMSLISEELRSGTFEQLATLPVRDEEIVLGKFIGFAGLALMLTAGLFFYPIVVWLVTSRPFGLDWGAAVGIIGGQYLLMLFYGAMGLFASGLAKNQVVAFIVGVLFCTAFFFLGQISNYFIGVFSAFGDALGVTSHLATLSRGVWDLRDLLYFGSVIGFFLYLTVQRLKTRRF